MNETLISVVIPTYKRPEALIRAIESVKLQTHSFWEIVVVDDNPADSREKAKTKELVDGLAAANIRLISHTQNLGACKARNTGMMNANGTYVAFLDDDDTWHNRKLEAQLSHIQSLNLDFDVCELTEVYQGGYRQIQFDFSQEFYSALLDRANGICTSAIMASKRVLEQINGFDESLPSYQDYDLLLRLAKSFRGDVLKQNLLTYNMADDGITKSHQKKMLGCAEIIKKHESEFISHGRINGLAKLIEALADFQFLERNYANAPKSYMQAMRLSGIRPGILLKVCLSVFRARPIFLQLLEIKRKLIHQAEK